MCYSLRYTETERSKPAITEIVLRLSACTVNPLPPLFFYFSTLPYSTSNLVRLLSIYFTSVRLWNWPLLDISLLSSFEKSFNCFFSLLLSVFTKWIVEETLAHANQEPDYKTIVLSGFQSTGEHHDSFYFSCLNALPSFPRICRFFFFFVFFFSIIPYPLFPIGFIHSPYFKLFLLVQNWPLSFMGTRVNILNESTSTIEKNIENVNRQYCPTSIVLRV